jgi:NitT/TauT family transport system substrate-binding protein
MKYQRFAAGLALLALFLSACGPAASTSTEPKELRQVTLGVGFIPNVQFAPLYVAQSKGFYADEGLDVVLEYGFENDFVKLAAEGEREFAVASGDQVILARSQELPIVYVMKWYQRFPVAVAVPKSAGVGPPTELAGRKVGIPGLFGASYVAWKALVYASGIDESSVQLESIGFTQAEALQQGAIDAAVVYIANEPVQLQSEGIELELFEVSDYIDLVSNGLVVGETLLNEDPELVRAMVSATLRGLQYTLDNPDEAFEIVRQVIREITDEDAPTQRAVLEASLPLWRSDSPGLTTQQAWQESVDFMAAAGLVDATIDVSKAFTNQFVEIR